MQSLVLVCLLPELVRTLVHIAVAPAVPCACSQPGANVMASTTYEALAQTTQVEGRRHYLRS